jgi:Protein of unknown function (DUF2752)
LTLSRAIPVAQPDLRRAAVGILGAAAVLPALPGHPGLPCPLRTLTGVPCPFCGMTTSVEATARLRLGHALAANPAGPLLVIGLLWLVIRRPTTLRYSLPLVWTALALMWAFELFRFHII